MFEFIENLADRILEVLVELAEDVYKTHRFHPSEVIRWRKLYVRRAAIEQIKESRKIIRKEMMSDPVKVGTQDYVRLNIFDKYTVETAEAKNFIDELKCAGFDVSSENEYEHRLTVRWAPKSEEHEGAGR